MYMQLASVQQLYRLLTLVCNLCISNASARLGEEVAGIMWGWPQRYKGGMHVALYCLGIRWFGSYICASVADRQQFDHLDFCTQ
jgi:hypothetical protein